MIRASDRLRAAAYVLRRCAEGKAALDAELLGALIRHLDSASHDVAELEARVVVRPRKRLSTREESLIALVHCAVELASPLWRPSLLRTLDRLLSRAEVVS